MTKENHTQQMVPQALWGPSLGEVPSLPSDFGFAAFLYRCHHICTSIDNNHGYFAIMKWYHEWCDQCCERKEKIV